MVTRGSWRFFAVLTAFLAGVAAPSALAAAELNTASDDQLDLEWQLRDLGFRDAEELSQYFTIGEIEVLYDGKPANRAQLEARGVLPSVQMTTQENSPDGGLFEALGGLAADLGDVKKWVTLGEKLWELIRNNQPVANVTTQTVSILPRDKPDWSEMETWKGPAAQTYTIQAKNLYGATVVSHTYTVAFNYGGSFRGHGKFLANATIIPTNVDVSWGFKLASSVEVGTPVNTGTLESPVPGVDLQLKWQMDSILKHLEGRNQFFVRGDGSVTHTMLK